MQALVQGRSAQVVVVTGASAGVGRAIVHRFARAGWRIGLIARDAAALDEVRREVEEMGGTALVAPADVADAQAVFAAAEQIASAFGAIDVWINDAMVTVFSPFWDMTPDEFHRVTEVTYLGFVHGTMAALRHMRPVDRGAIIQIGSALAYRGIPLQSAYCGAKHAIRGFTNALRTELLHEGSNVRLTMVELPAVNTPQFDWARTHMPKQPRPVAPVVQPEVIAQTVFEAVQRPPREVWIGLSTLKVILGNMLLPAFLDRYLARFVVGAQETTQPVSPERADNLVSPVTALHRTRGRFGSEAQDSAIVVSGPMFRVLPVLIGGAALLAIGFAAGTGSTRTGVSTARLPRRHAGSRRRMAIT
ncbi:MAG TPA: SDR family oxidoreductase [Bradyrhizobium sp.]|nr:SDR family oxidoreductase [Bradyrhizobium sp.]